MIGENLEESARAEKIAELEILRQSLEEKEKETFQWKDQALRCRAELENARRRWDKERPENLEYGRFTVLRALAPILEQLEHCLNALRKDGAVDPQVKAGFELFEKNRDKFLGEMGVTRVEAQPGGVFDPLHQEAARLVESDLEEGHIAAVDQAGLLLGNRLIRPARVAVAKKKIS